MHCPDDISTDKANPMLQIVTFLDGQGAVLVRGVVNDGAVFQIRLKLLAAIKLRVIIAA